MHPAICRSGKRLVSSVTAVLLAVSNMTAGMPSLAISNLSGTKDIDDVTLLIGTGNDEIRGDSVQKTVDNAADMYALGIASQFCVFLKDEFKPLQADAEGRVAVGGNFIAATQKSEYESGNGDFYTQASLDALLGYTDFAHSIVNGDTVSGFTPTSWNAYKYVNEDGTTYTDHVDKRIWVDDNATVTPPSNFVNNAGDRWSGNYDDYVFTGSDVFDVAAQYDELIKRGTTLPIN